MAKCLSMVRVETNQPLELTRVMMIRYAIEDSQHPNVLAWAREVPIEYPLDRRISAVFDLVHSRVRFMTDQQRFSDATEVLSRPSRTVVDLVGDCDDFSMLVAALILALGLPVRIDYVVISTDGQNFDHVYVLVQKPDGSLVPLDASHGPFPGWFYPGKLAILWPVADNRGKKRQYEEARCTLIRNQASVQ